MTLRDARPKLTDAFSLLDFSERLLDDIDNQPLSELFRTLQLVRKNIRDAMNLINDAEAEIDDVIKEIDKQEELEATEEAVEDLVMYGEWKEENERLLGEQSFKGVGE